MIIWITMLFILMSWATVFSQADRCGEPPPVANESLKGVIKGEAQALSRWLGKAELGGQIQTSREEIFSKYPDAEVSRSNAYFEYVFCVILMQDKSLTSTQKIEEWKKIRREFSKPLGERSDRQELQKQNGIQADFYGCTRESTNMVMCEVKFTNIANKRKRILMQHRNIWLIQGEKDRYNADTSKINGQERLYNNYVSHEVTPEGSAVFQINFLIKPSSQGFDKLEIGLGQVTGSQRFVFPIN